MVYVNVEDGFYFESKEKLREYFEQEIFEYYEIDFENFLCEKYSMHQVFHFTEYEKEDARCEFFEEQFKSWIEQYVIECELYK